jgi:hypothetical protein
MIAEDCSEILYSPEERASIYERLAAAIELGESYGRLARTGWERELWEHIVKLCGEALGEVGEIVDKGEPPHQAG